MKNQAIIDFIRSKNEREIKNLYDKNKPPFINYFRKYYFISNDEITEMYQESFYTAYSKIRDGYPLTGKLDALLIGIGKNLYRDEIIRISKNVPLEEAYGQCDENSSIDLDETKQDLIRKAVEKLAEPCKTILRKYYHEKIKYQELVMEMKNYKNINVLKVQKHKCIQYLKKAILEAFKKMELI